VNAKKEIRVAKCDNSDVGANGDTAFFQKLSNINGFRASNSKITCIFPKYL